MLTVFIIGAILCTIYKGYFMTVPAEIRAVKRPVNTVVVDLGVNTPKRFAVRARKSVKYVKGGNPQPQNGKVVGYIYKGQFVPKEVQVDPEIPNFLSWGAAAFVRSLSEDILQDLLKIMDIKDALRTFILSALRVIYPGVPNSRLRSRYLKSFLSIFFPGIPLSENTVSKHLWNLGANLKLREKFYSERLKRVASEHHIAIDGMLVQDTSKVNDLSGFSYKARVKGCKELSVLYAYDVERSEPVCAQVFPGNHPDVSTCKEFITTNHINKGILVADKGFNLKEIRKLHSSRPELHYLIAIKRNDSRLTALNMLEMEEFLGGEIKPVFCSKVKADEKTWLYAFRDSVRASLEEKTYIEQAQKRQDFSNVDFQKKRPTFGVLAFESDLELPFETVYSIYRNRWDLELIFKQYKTGLEADETRVQGDFEVIGSEFINFISTIITSRMVKAEREAGLLEKHSYGEILEDLREIWRLTESEEKADVQDNGWVHTTIEAKDILVKLGLATAPEAPKPKKKGRPKKNTTLVEQPKRPRGRPRVRPLPEPGMQRKPGRPRKDKPVFVGPKRPRGRPRKIYSSES